MGYVNSVLSMYEMPPPLSAPSTTKDKMAGVAGGADRFNKGKCWNIPGVSSMLWLQTQGGADWLRDMLVGPPEDRKAALDAILAVQTSEYLTLSQFHQAAILRHSNAEPEVLQRLLPGKYKADTHLLRLVELQAKLSAPPSVNIASSGVVNVANVQQVVDGTRGDAPTPPPEVRGRNPH